MRIGRKKRGTPRRRLSNVASGEEIGQGRVREEGGEEEGEERFEQQKEGRNGRFELVSKYQLLPSVREPQQDRRRRRGGGGGEGRGGGYASCPDEGVMRQFMSPSYLLRGRLSS